MGRTPSTVYALSVGLGTSYFVLGIVFLIAVIHVLNRDLTKVNCEGTSLFPPVKSFPTYFTTYPVQWPCAYLALEFTAGILAIMIGLAQACFNLAALGTDSAVTPWFVWLLLHVTITIIGLILAITILAILTTTADGLLSLLDPNTTLSLGLDKILPNLPPIINLTKTRAKTIRAMVQLFIIWTFLDSLFCIVGSVCIIRCRKELLTQTPGKLETKLDKLFDKIGVLSRKQVFPEEPAMISSAKSSTSKKGSEERMKGRKDRST